MIMANEKDLKDLTREELIERVEKLEGELKNSRACTGIYREENEKLKAKLEIIANTLKL
jgi:hypothetical protein